LDLFQERREHLVVGHGHVGREEASLAFKVRQVASELLLETVRVYVFMQSLAEV